MKCFVRKIKGNLHASFEWAGVSYTHSLRTKDEREAEVRIAPIRDTLYRLEQGTLRLPLGVDSKSFILAGGQVIAEPEPSRPVLTLDEMTRAYLAGVQRIETNTRLTTRIHLKHVARIIGGGMAVDSIGLVDVQRYANARLKESRNGKKIQSLTVRKELATLRQVCGWAADQEMIPRRPGWAIRSVDLPKDRGREPFRTYSQINAIIARGRSSSAEQERLWETLYLTSEDIAELLAYARENAPEPHIYPMIAFVALTGCRRSEMCRSLVDDWDLENGTVTIREKKRDRGKTFTLREVDIHPILKESMIACFKEHPGGQYAVTPNGKPLNPSHATKYLVRTLAGNEKWSKIRGFHTLRHSVASILASKGVDQRYIDRILGHQTEAMRKRYQHLFPKGVRQAIELLV